MHTRNRAGLVFYALFAAVLLLGMTLGSGFGTGLARDDGGTPTTGGGDSSLGEQLPTETPTPITTRYVPATGWTSGIWTFTVVLESVGASGVAVVVGQAPVDGTIGIP